MPSKRIEGVCEFYDPAGGRCNKVGGLITLENLRSAPSRVELGKRRDWTPRGIFNPSTWEMLVSEPVSYFQPLCEARGLGGSVSLITVSKQRKCTGYSPRYTAYRQILRG